MILSVWLRTVALKVLESHRPGEDIVASRGRGMARHEAMPVARWMRYILHAGFGQ